jgi:hypothetical protein
MPHVLRARRPFLQRIPSLGSIDLRNRFSILGMDCLKGENRTGERKKPDLPLHLAAEKDRGKKSPVNSLNGIDK